MIVNETKTRLSWEIFAILLFALFLRLISFVGIDGADDAAVAGFAEQILNTGFSAPEVHYQARIGLTLPLALIFRVFGVGDIQFAFIPLAASLLSIVMAYLIGVRVAGKMAGLLAAFLLAIFPLDVYFASQLFPDGPMGALVAVAYYLVLIAEDSRRGFLLGMIAGIVLGVAWLVKVEAIFLLPVLGVYLLFDFKRYWRSVVGAGVGMLCVLAMEGAVYYFLANDALRSIHAALNQGNGKYNAAFAGGELWVFPKEWFLTPYFFGVHYYLLTIAMVWAITTKSKPYLVLFSWIAIYLIWLEFGGNPFAETYHVKSHLARYCLTISVPTAVLVAIFLAWIYKKRPWVGVFGIAGTTLLSLLLINFNTLGAEASTATKRALDYAVLHNTFPLYLDKRSADIAYWYLHDKVDRKLIIPAQAHDFVHQKTTLVQPKDMHGWFLENRVFEQFNYNRYGMEYLHDTNKSQYFAAEFSVSNPMNRFAYWETRAVAKVLSNLPSNYFVNKAKDTALQLLDGQEVFLYRKLPIAPAGEK